jgi:hypothetical protein
LQKIEKKEGKKMEEQKKEATVLRLIVIAQDKDGTEVREEFDCGILFGFRDEHYGVFMNANLPNCMEAFDKFGEIIIDMFKDKKERFLRRIFNSKITDIMTDIAKDGREKINQVLSR